MPLTLSVLTALSSALGAAPSTSAAGRFIDETGTTEYQSPRNEARPGHDPQALLRKLTGISVARFELAGTAAPLGAGGGLTGFLGVRSLDVNMPLGHLTSGHFEWATLSHQEPFRFRATAFQSHGGFFCVDADGNLKLPYVGKLQGFCRPDSKIGMGFTLAEVQSEPGAGRFALRWIETRVLFNLLGNGHGDDSLNRRLDFSAGLGGESAFWNQTQHHVRGILGLSGIYRSRDARWELDGKIAARPSLSSTHGFWSDRAWEAQATATHHFPIRKFAVGSVGLVFRYDHWDRPDAAIGTLASNLRTDNWNILFVTGGRLEFSKY